MLLYLGLTVPRPVKPDKIVVVNYGNTATADPLKDEHLLQIQVWKLPLSIPYF